MAFARGLQFLLRSKAFIARNPGVTFTHLWKAKQFSSLAAARGRCSHDKLQNRLPSTSQVMRYVSSSTTTVERDDEEHMLSITWWDRQPAQFPYVWLRDSCQCPQCYDSNSPARLLQMHNLDVDCKPKDIKLDETLNTLTLIWEDDHISKFNLDWLQQRGHTDDIIRRRHQYRPLPFKTWGSEFANHIPTNTFDKIISDDYALHDWILNLERYGFSLITGAPLETGQLNVLAQRVAFLRVTNYGETFHIKAKDESSQTYNIPRGFHTDLPYYTNTPGVRLLHCINQMDEGGAVNLFADGFFAAKEVRRLRPDLYDILCHVLVEFHDVGTDLYQFHKFARKPVISFDKEGIISQINYNNQVRDYCAHLPANELRDLYRAMRFFDDIMYDSDNHIEIKLNDGDIACFHNYRVLRGRGRFEVDPKDEPHFEGGYIDWDELHSRRRVLQAHLKKEDEHFRGPDFV